MESKVVGGLGLATIELYTARRCGGVHPSGLCGG